MEVVGKIIDFLRAILPTLLAYKAGRDSKEKDQLKDENEKLKKFKKIDDREVMRNEVYDPSEW